MTVAKYNPPSIHAASKQRYGRPRVHQELQAQGRTVGRHRVARLMRQAQMAGALVIGPLTAFLDNGLSNIGVRPTAEDLGRGGMEAGKPLSFVRQRLLGLGFAPELPGCGGLGQVLCPTGDRVEEEDEEPLVEFLLSLTDDRVRKERAPFDRPQLFVPNGHAGNQSVLECVSGMQACDDLLDVPAVGAKGRRDIGLPPLGTFLAVATERAPGRSSEKRLRRRATVARPVAPRRR